MLRLNRLLVSLNSRAWWTHRFQFRQSSGGCGTKGGKQGLVLGVYEGCEPGQYTLTPAATKFDEAIGGKFRELVKGTRLRLGEVQMFGNLSEDFYLVAAAGLGHESATMNPNDQLDECKENIRVASGRGAMRLQSQGISNVFVEEFTNAEAAAEGATLGVWRYQEWKTKENQENKAEVTLWESDDKEGWIRGVIKAEAQNKAREMEETPSNLMTPLLFGQFAQELLCPCGVEVQVHDRDWMESNNLMAFLNMARGSCEPPSVLEINYCGADKDEKPIMMIGKGATFDAGGIDLKPCRGMSLKRAQLAGAATIVSAIRAIAQLSIPVNVTALLAMYEHLPSGIAIKPGDVLVARNGKTIKVEDTDNEGRVVLADVLSLTNLYDPCLNITVLTSHVGTRRNLGNPVTMVWSTSDMMYYELVRAGSVSGDRVWRLPLWKYYRTRVTDFTEVDVHNVGKGHGLGGGSLAAAYLLEFSPPNVDFIMFDISGTGINHFGIGSHYLRKHCMTGRPVRLIIEFFYQIACPHLHDSPC